MTLPNVLPSTPLTPRPYQRDAALRAIAKIRAGESELMIAPTGSGKSLIQALIKLALGPTHYQTAPSTEIALGILDKMGVVDMALVRSRGFAKQQAAHEEHGIFTIKRLYNLLMTGAIPLPSSLSFDESHHSVDNTHTLVHAMCGHCPRVGLTATGYRGTPEETAKLIESWGAPHVILTLREAVAQKVISKPNFIVWPLVNDDLIKIVNGEFQLSTVEGKIEETLPALVQRVKAELCYVPDGWGDKYLPKRMTMVRAPGVNSAKAITHALRQAGIPAVCMTGDETDSGVDLFEERQAAFARCIRREAILVQVKVVSEGVDLPVRVLIDLAPCMSPVAWMQSVGRQTRPVPDGEDPPLYIATNHNLTRHAYLWEGMIPPGQIRDAQKVWGDDYKPSRRSVARALGLEGFGKFQVGAVPVDDGSVASIYALQTKDGMHLYAVLLHPCMAEPWFFEKVNEPTNEVATFVKDGRTIEYKKKRYGPWKRIAKIPDLAGYVSVRPDFVSDGMMDYWRTAAGSVGLDASADPDGRSFQALPILKNCRLPFRFSD